jgi:hypothetical protein
LTFQNRPNNRFEYQYLGISKSIGMISLKIKSYLLEGLNITDRILNDIIFMCEARTKSTFFTKKGAKMGFKNLMIFMLNFVKKSLQLELDAFFNDPNDNDFNVSKQAFSEARNKISPDAFITMSDAILKWFYKDTDFKRFNGFRLLAIDGTVLEISDNDQTRAELGHVENQTMKSARALASCIYDVENDMMVATKISKYTSSERALATELINKVEELGFHNDLFLFDRGYPSREFMTFIENKHQKYLMRVSKSFLKVVNETKEEDQVIQVMFKGNILNIRVIRFMLESGIEEVLVTNILDKSFSVEYFKVLYFKRWGIESKYDEVKNRLQIENFTGKTVISIKQDFYASMYLTNMVSLAKKDANPIISERNKNKNLKYEYKVNTNILVGKLKDSLVAMMLVTSPRKRSKMLKNIIKEISRNVIPIRPGRIKPRIFKSGGNKHIIARKKVL